MHFRQKATTKHKGSQHKVLPDTAVLPPPLCGVLSEPVFPFHPLIPFLRPFIFFFLVALPFLFPLWVLLGAIDSRAHHFFETMVDGHCVRDEGGFTVHRLVAVSFG